MDRRQIRAARLKEIWFDPRYGHEHLIHANESGAFQTYTPSTSGHGNDWLLILEREIELSA